MHEAVVSMSTSQRHMNAKQSSLLWEVMKLAHGLYMSVICKDAGKQVRISLSPGLFTNCTARLMPSPLMGTPLCHSTEAATCQVQGLAPLTVVA